MSSPTVLIRSNFLLAPVCCVKQAASATESTDIEQTGVVSQPAVSHQ